MLVLSRKVGERIHIGSDSFIEVRRIAGNRVTLAVSAPKSVRILRGELVEAAKAFEVLDESVASEAENDTVIISPTPATPSEPLTQNLPLDSQSQVDS